MKYALFIFAVIIVLIVFEELTKKSKPKNKSLNCDVYKLKNSIVTNREMQLYKQLQNEIPNRYLICPKVGVKDFIQITEKKDYMKHFGRISQKHIDYLICEKETLKPVLGIELDDKSHQKGNRQNRDEFVNAVYENIGLKILRIPTSMSNEEIKKELTTIFNPPIEIFNENINL